MEGDMRRLMIASLVLLSSLSLFSAPAVGYSLAPVGEMGEETYGALNIALFFSLDRDSHAGDMEISVDLSPYGKVFQGVNARISTPVFATTDHPFNVLFPNAMMWAPKLSVGALFRMPSDWAVTVGLSPFSFYDTNYVFEFLSPYVLYSITCNKWGWGMHVVRFSYFFGKGGAS